MTNSSTLEVHKIQDVFYTAEEVEAFKAAIKIEIPTLIPGKKIRKDDYFKNILLHFWKEEEKLSGFTNEIDRALG